MERISFVALLRAFDCLIDTAERTTDLEHVYNDRTGDAVEWNEVHKLRDLLADKYIQSRDEEN
jgi:hypothetical protein